MSCFTARGDDRYTQVLGPDVHTTRAEDPRRRYAGAEQEARRRSSQAGERRG